MENDEDNKNIESENIPKDESVINEDSPSEVVSKATETIQDNNKIQPEEENKQENKVFHKKDGRLHIYVRQDKYKGELKSKNWVGRLYINGKQKISSSGTQNLEEAIPILEKWFDEVQSEAQQQSEAQKNEQKKEVMKNHILILL